MRLKLDTVTHRRKFLKSGTIADLHLVLSASFRRQAFPAENRSLQAARTQ
jgi:hypothetical protein